MIGIEFLTTAEVADILRVTTETIERWRRKRKLPAVRIGRKWLFNSDDIRERLRFPPISRPPRGSYDSVLRSASGRPP